MRISSVSHDVLRERPTPKPREQADTVVTGVHVVCPEMEHLRHQFDTGSGDSLMVSSGAVTLPVKETRLSRTERKRRRRVEVG